MVDVLQFFHHIHHCKYGNIYIHKVEHCGNCHAIRSKEVNYINCHCRHGKHFINVKKAIGHDADLKPVLFVFSEKCGTTGWHIESGKSIGIYNDDFSNDLHILTHTKDMKHKIKHKINVIHCNKHKKHLDLTKSGHVFKEDDWFC